MRPKRSAASAPRGSPVRTRLVCGSGRNGRREPLRATAAGEAADSHLGELEHRRRGRDAEVRGQHELEPAAHCGAVHRRDQRLPEPSAAWRPGRLCPAGAWRPRLVEVHACAERGAVASEDGYANGVGCVEPRHDLGESRAHRGRDRVPPLGNIERDPGDAVGHRDSDRSLDAHQRAFSAISSSTSASVSPRSEIAISRVSAPRNGAGCSGPVRPLPSRKGAAGAVISPMTGWESVRQKSRARSWRSARTSTPESTGQAGTPEA